MSIPHITHMPAQQSRQQFCHSQTITAREKTHNNQTPQENSEKQSPSHLQDFNYPCRVYTIQIHITQLPWLSTTVLCRLRPGTRQRPAWSRGICRGQHFKCEPVIYQLCPDSDRPGPGVGRVSILYANRSVTGCVPAPGSNLPGPGVRWIGSSYVGHFGLTPPTGPSRRGCPG